MAPGAARHRVADAGGRTLTKFVVAAFGISVAEIATIAALIGHVNAVTMLGVLLAVTAVAPSSG